MSITSLSDGERAVLRFLAAEYGEFGCFGFSAIMRETDLARHAVQTACRSLAAKGLTRFQRGLFTDDGEVAGAGYCATEAGRDLARAEGLL